VKLNSQSTTLTTEFLQCTDGHRNFNIPNTLDTLDAALGPDADTIFILYTQILKNEYNKIKKIKMHILLNLDFLRFSRRRYFFKYFGSLSTV